MKISKTLKRLRAEKGITQEQLAEMLFISRQSVSSWENDRTQPDLEMLGRLSEIFGVSVEELVYGKKRNITLETEKPNHNSTLIIVFSILGALLAGTGLVLIFVTFWQKMPLLIKAVLSLLPLIAGQGAGVFVLTKKKNKIPWCEGAGVLWCAGIAATLAMIYNVFGMGFYWHTLLIVESVLILPVMFILKCVSPVIVYYGTAIAWFLSSGIYALNSIFPALSVTVILLSVGCAFTNYMVKTDKKSLRSLYSHWISITAIPVFLIGLTLDVSGEFAVGIGAAGAVGVCLLLISLKDSDIAMPYRIPGLMLTSVYLFGSGAFFYGSLSNRQENIVLSSAIIGAVIISAVIIFLWKTKVKDKILLSYICVSTLSLIVLLTVSFFIPSRVSQSNADEIFITVMKIIAIAANILLMISGGKEKKLLPINTGFISVTALTFLIIYQSDLSMLINGLLLLVSGAVLLIINYRLSKKPKKIPVTENTEEVQRDE